MKLNKVSQLVLVSAIGLAVATLLSGCIIVTIDWVFVADSVNNTPGSAGQIEAFATDSQTGALRPAAAPPPCRAAARSLFPWWRASDYTDLYVANRGNSTDGSFRHRPRHRRA